MLTFFIDTLPTPVGELLIITDSDNQLRAVDWKDHEARIMTLLKNYYKNDSFQTVPTKNPGELTQIIQRYFAGELRVIEQLPVITAGTAFQRQVWQELRKIPCGKTICYGELAKRIGQPKASRAVGMANNRNPISIVIPCHRVIGAQGALTGYAGGLYRKKWLLNHEGCNI